MRYSNLPHPCGGAMSNKRLLSRCVFSPLLSLLGSTLERPENNQFASWAGITLHPPDTVANNLKQKAGASLLGFNS
jgi:hypothetical protein